MLPKIFAPNAIDVVSDALKKFVEAEVDSGKKYKAGETILFGWSWFRVDGSGSNLEITGPVAGEMPMNFQSDCSDALNTILKQRYLCDSFGQSMQPCNARQSAIVVKDLARCKEIFINRTEPENGNISGWFIGARDSQSDVGRAEHLELKSLWELSCILPKIVDFFLLPVNWQVLFLERPIVLNNYEPVACSEGSYFLQKYES